MTDFGKICKIFKLSIKLSSASH